VLILADKDTEKKQQELMDAVVNNRYTVVEDYLHDPVSFIAVIPEPGRLFSEQFRPYMAAVLVKGKVSLDEARAEMVALSYDPKRAQDLAQLMSDTRLMAIGVARVRYGGTGKAETALESLIRAQIRAEGPTVILRSMMPGSAIEAGLPRVLQALSKGIGRIRRGPGYPS
jgi:hypothetical protein